MKPNDLFEVNSSAFDFQGTHRLLWVLEAFDIAFTIEVPPMKNGARASYFKGPKQRSLQGLKAALGAGDLKPTTISHHGIAFMQDAQIEARYPAPKGKVSAPIRDRDAMLTVIQPVLDLLRKNPRHFFFEGGMRAEVTAVIASSKFSTHRIYSAVHKYLALGIGKNALLPSRFACGAPGKERTPKTRLGNSTKAYKAGLTDKKGFAPQTVDKEHMAWCWAAFMDGKNSVEDAYALALGVYWSKGTKIKHGREQPVLLPTHQRPTLAQFRRWGPKGVENKDAWETMLSLNEWESNYRGLSGGALDGLRTVGQAGQGDATSADHHLVTGASRLKPIGSAVRLVIQDVLTSMICGFHLGLEAPSGQIALLSVLSAATSKVELCRKYGLEIQEDDIPPVFFNNYLVDNGEFRTKRVRDVLVSLGSEIEYTPTHRGDRKGMSEAGHRSVHKMSGHKTTGTTKGRQRKRGETAPALEACWRFHEHMRLFLMAVIYHNCEQRVERFYNDHPYATAMKRAGVPPIRKAIYQWCIQQGLVSSPPFHEDALKGALLPEMKAVVRENGVFLLRPDVGNRTEVIQGHRFLGPCVTNQKWLERARRDGNFGINVRVDPNHLEHIWYVDELGLNQLINVASDSELVRNATLLDSLVQQDQDVENRELARQTTEQANADLVIARSVDDDHFRRQKAKEIKAQKKKPTKASLTRGVRENREAESALLSSGEKRIPEPAPVPDTESVSELLETPSADWLDDVLSEHRSDG